MRKILPLLAFALLMACTAPTQQAAMDEKPGLRVTDTTGTDHFFNVELATTDHQIERGLMMREHLPEDGGMLFLFATPDVWQFWMKDTLVPLDMLFIAPGGKIIKIKANAQPNDWTAISSGKIVAAVLEIPGGQAKKRGITVGSMVALPAYPKK